MDVAPPDSEPRPRRLPSFWSRFPASAPAAGVVVFERWRPNAWGLVVVSAALIGIFAGIVSSTFFDRGPIAKYEYHLWTGWQKDTFPATVFGLLGIGPEPGQRQGEGAVREYFRLTSAIRAAQADGADAARLESVIAERARHENGVERYVAGLLSEAIRDAGLDRGLPLFRGVRLTWPPVNFELAAPPRLLVRSPRERVFRADDTLLRTDLKLSDIARIEEEADNADTVSVVIPIGGLAAYPAIVSGDRQFDDWLNTTAHEWVHHYLAFYPLGEQWGNGGDAEPLNETTANIAGAMIAKLVRKRHPLSLPPEADGRGPSQDCPEPKRIDFTKEMRQVRLDVDAMLAAGDVAGAEAFMEEKRLYLAEHCVNIRKLNQAYFAFHGTYADTPASSNPIGPKIERLRQLSGDVATFLAAMRQVTSAAALDRTLAAFEAAAP